MVVDQGSSVDDSSAAAGIAFYRAYAITFRAGLPIECFVSVASGTDIQPCSLADIALLGHSEFPVRNLLELFFHFVSPHFTYFGGHWNSRVFSLHHNPDHANIATGMIRFISYC